MPPLLQVRDLTIVLGGHPRVEGVSFDLDKGECLAILGPNGAGKTLLLRALLGLVRFTGQIHWAPEVRVGYVPQKIAADRDLPIHFGNLIDARLALARASRHDRDAILEEVGLDPRLLSVPVGRLSGGQFQRALFAFALVSRPNVLLLDEPTASIDAPGEEHLYELVGRLQERRGIAVIVVSHELSLVYAHASRVLCLNRATLCVGTPQEALTPAALERLYGAPARFYHTQHHHE